MENDQLTTVEQSPERPAYSTSPTRRESNPFDCAQGSTLSEAEGSKGYHTLQISIFPPFCLLEQVSRIFTPMSKLASTSNSSVYSAPWSNCPSPYTYNLIIFFLTIKDLPDCHCFQIQEAWFSLPRLALCLSASSGTGHTTPMRREPLSSGSGCKRASARQSENA